jgi:5-methylcytosine-specific restriction endonuclease McrA
MNYIDNPGAYSRIRQAKLDAQEVKGWRRKKPSRSLRARVFAEKGRACFYCAEPDCDILDHRKPVSLGGGTSFENLVPCCPRCNSRKFNKPQDQWEAECVSS